MARCEDASLPTFSVAHEGASPHKTLWRTAFERESGLYVLLLLVLGLVIRLVPAYLIYGSYDVGAWRTVLMYQGMGKNPYLTHKLNWPPLWPTLLLWAGRLEAVYHLPDYFAVKLPAILCDVAVGFALYFYCFFKNSAYPHLAFRRALWYILNPVAIFTCAVHGQFDCIPALFTLLAVIALERCSEERFPVVTSLWLSLGVLARTWPGVLAPLFLPRIQGWARRLLFLAIVFVPSAVSLWILYLQAPHVILHDVVYYRGDIGDWGLASTANLLPTRPWWRAVNGWIVRKLLYLGWLTLYLIFWRRRVDMGKLVCLAIANYYVFTPHAGQQHFEWIVPMAVLADIGWLRFYTVVAGATLLLYYYLWPFNGEHFDFLSHQHTMSYYHNYLSLHAHFGTTLLMLPLWGFCVVWYGALWRRCLRESI
ncbi:hypothetical protein CTKA_00508 [Chthonomonas calidirosea]|uniref:Uncharacterized protein n=1 Tax=Chthonomonas calidirosea (strain DSM 23976 / ICMP 18418 / T49) TaxID=1303518 RepID=S0EXF4_CHTCT|nr:hypothetical protein [Chthonomonas calidirosea]CCW34473.1 hypothetical protein CCALI_00647 [Chthonomonas calidirosea T49]CEK14683.1 hypothetical protein CTKA_00508 [Chthonomonas calidirosea]